MTTIVDIPYPDPIKQADGDPGDEASPRETIHVPVPAGDHNREVQVLDKRRNYDGVLTPFTHEPIGDQLVIRRLPEEEGLIIESDNAKEAPLRCEVIAVSKHPSFNYAAVALAALHPGDHILIRRFAGTDVKVDNMEYVIINVFDVLLKFAERG